MIVRWLTAAAIVISAALVGLAVWVVGLKGFANRAESICLADTDNRIEYGAYRMSRELWLPSFECHLLGNSVDSIDVQHRLEATMTLGWLVVVPVLYAIATLTFTMRWALRPHGRDDT